MRQVAHFGRLRVPQFGNERAVYAERAVEVYSVVALVGHEIYFAVGQRAMQERKRQRWVVAFKVGHNAMFGKHFFNRGVGIYAPFAVV